MITVFALDVRHHPDSVDRASLLDLAELDATLRRACPDLPRPVLLAWSELPAVTVDDRGRPWLYGPVERDVHRRRGRSVVPREQLRQLAGLAELDVPFERLALAHELDPEGPVRELLPELRGGPRTCTDEVARELVGPVPAHPGVARAVRGIGAVAGAAGSAVAAGLDLLLDPVIFGVVAPSWLRHGALGAFYPLTAWRW